MIEDVEYVSAYYDRLIQKLLKPDFGRQSLLDMIASFTSHAVLIFPETPVKNWFVSLNQNGTPGQCSNVLIPQL